MSYYYQKKRNNPHWLPDNVYRQTASIINRYDEILAQLKELLSAPEEEQKEKGAVIYEVSRKAEAIEQTANVLNAKYAKTYTGEAFDALGAFKDYAVFCYYRSKKSKDEAPCRKTWTRYRREFIYLTAKKLNYF